ncbi:hypothetical protein LV89_02054 [Arcicella aurantiaca]|uniref:Lipoprotein n=1 Tax=Arcicella aurantiaca TaxID=591202 RepID=A0A316EUG1_9BACT|nr:hypothetical protein [Arcicella aurantiaca]PWK26848.1 hypothetical protein LV89_02054 [Arcicella aurantiaca]
MKKTLLILLTTSMALTSCSNPEVEQLKKENAALAAQVQALKTGGTAKGPKYILKIKLKQSHFSLSIKKHIKDAVNAIEFELPVDKEFFDSVSEGTELVDNFRFGSMVLYGSFGDWEMTVKDKEIRQQ